MSNTSVLLKKVNRNSMEKKPKQADTINSLKGLYWQSRAACITFNDPGS